LIAAGRRTVPLELISSTNFQTACETALCGGEVSLANFANGGSLAALVVGAMAFSLTLPDSLAARCRSYAGIPPSGRSDRNMGDAEGGQVEPGRFAVLWELQHILGRQRGCGLVTQGKRILQNL